MLTDAITWTQAFYWAISILKVILVLVSLVAAIGIICFVLFFILRYIVGSVVIVVASIKAEVDRLCQFEWSNTLPIVRRRNAPLFGKKGRR